METETSFCFNCGSHLCLRCKHCSRFVCIEPDYMCSSSNVIREPYINCKCYIKHQVVSQETKLKSDKKHLVVSQEFKLGSDKKHQVVSQESKLESDKK